jgi:hypothetical protein
MSRHASAEELARLNVGDLRRRKSVKVAAHVVGCVRCTRIRQELTEVPAVLAATPYPPMPEGAYVRIEAALRVEVSERLSVAPATEAGRRDLPARARRQWSLGSQPGWRLPGLSVPATRLVAAAGAVVLVGGGGYLLATELPAGAGSSSSSSAALPAPVKPMSLGPDITYGRPGSQHTVQTVSSTTDFEPTQLRTQALGAYHEAQLKGAEGSQSSGGVSAPNDLGPQNNATAGFGALGSQSGAQLAGCIGAIGPGRTVLLLDLAKYQGKPATIIVFASTTSSQAEVVVTADNCSATSPGVLARAPLGHLPGHL